MCRCLDAAWITLGHQEARVRDHNEAKLIDLRFSQEPVHWPGDQTVSNLTATSAFSTNFITPMVMEC